MAVRTVCIPVAEVLEGGSKSEFYMALRQSLAISVRVANLAMTECVKQDDWSQEKLGKVYCYPAVKSEGHGCSIMIACISRQVEKAYRQDRWGVIRGKKSLRSFRSMPWPLLSNKSTQTMHIEDCGEFLSAKIKLAGGWWVVRLRSSSDYRQQVKAVREAVANSTYCDSKIWMDRRGIAVLGICCEFEAKEKSGIGELSVVSARDSLLVMTKDRSSVPFVINADEAKGWIAEADRKMQRLRQDRKSGIDRRRLQEKIDRVSAKSSDRFKSLCHKVSSTVVAKACRLNVAVIRLDTTVRSYIKHFPWHQLKTCIEYKASALGISVIDSTQSVVDPDILQPHVYFKYSPLTNRIKIGKTQREDGGRHGRETDSPDEQLVILAIDNQPKSKLAAKEKHYHALFADHRIVKNKEWFFAEPIIEWLQEVRWLGNAGNLSQIQQYMDVTHVASIDGSLRANRECSDGNAKTKCSQNADKRQGYLDASRAALAVDKVDFVC